MTAAPTTQGRFQRGTVVFLVAVGLGALGVLLAGLGLWKATVWLLAGALLLCSVARLLLAEQSAGLLRVRRRAIDVLAFALLGVGIVVMYLSLPSRG